MGVLCNHCGCHNMCARIGSMKGKDPHPRRTHHNNLAKVTATSYVYKVCLPAKNCPLPWQCCHSRKFCNSSNSLGCLECTSRAAEAPTTRKYDAKVTAWLTTQALPYLMIKNQAKQD